MDPVHGCEIPFLTTSQRLGVGQLTGGIFDHSSYGGSGSWVRGWGPGGLGGEGGGEAGEGDLACLHHRVLRRVVVSGVAGPLVPRGATAYPTSGPECF